MTLDDSLKSVESAGEREGRVYDLAALEEQDSCSREWLYGMIRKRGSKVSVRKFLSDIYDFRRRESNLPRRFREPQRYAEFSDGGTMARILVWSYRGIKPSRIPYK